MNSIYTRVLLAPWNILALSRGWRCSLAKWTRWLWRASATPPQTMLLGRNGARTPILTFIATSSAKHFPITYILFRTISLTRHLLGYFATRDLLGRGVKRPHVITRERMAAERRPMRRSKAIDETILKHPLNFPNEVTCQVKVRLNVKIEAFRLRAVETSKLSVLGQNLLRVLLKYRARHWLSRCLILSSVQGQDQVTKGHHT